MAKEKSTAKTIINHHAALLHPRDKTPRSGRNKVSKENALEAAGICAGLAEGYRFNFDPQDRNALTTAAKALMEYCETIHQPPELVMAGRR